jgi:hypothetical protein
MRNPAHARGGSAWPASPRWRDIGVQLRCVAWLAAVCAIDFSTTFSAQLMLLGCLLEFWCLSRRAAPGQGLRAAFGQWQQRLQTPPPQMWMFAGVMLLNVALEHWLVEPVSRPYLFNILTIHTMILLWACLATPAERGASRQLHRWAGLFISALGLILLTQLALRYGLDYTWDLRQMLTGEASRSGVEEGSEGERPTTIFMEPSCLAITAFTLLLVARLTGPRQTWLTAVTAMTCLLNNSGIGLLLTLYLLVEELLVQLRKNPWLVPLTVGTLLALGLLAMVVDLRDFKLLALDQILHPTTRYDPVAARAYVPQRIMNFDALEHLIGSGIANYAAFKDGFTQYDSSFLLAVYYQMGWLGLPMLLVTLHAAWRGHSVVAMGMVAALFSTKMGLIAPPFWAVVALLHYRHAMCPPPQSAPQDAIAHGIRKRKNRRAAKASFA